jgi:hypothetical protein
MPDDLWPQDIAESNMVTPVSILKEQAALLGDKTSQLVKGEVVTQAVGNFFHHQFFVVAPTLSYRYELFLVTHGVSFYPITLKRPFETTAPMLPNEDAFKQALKDIFASPQTLNVVHSILAQVRA